MLLADDSPVFLAAAETLVAATPGFEVAATCGSGREAVAIAARLRPDLALIDESMPDLDGPKLRMRSRWSRPRRSSSSSVPIPA